MPLINSAMTGFSFSAFVFHYYYVAFLFVFASSARGQTTDPSEVRALNAIFAQWNIKANTTQWNTTGDPCSGSAIDNTADFNDVQFNPFIKCDCSFNNRSLCHITQLKVYALDVRGTIPEQLWTLTYLFNMDLGQNFLSGTLSPSIGNLTRLQYLSLGINALSGEIPKELGQLTELLILFLSTNSFSGPLPPELGNLSKLQQLYIDSAGLSGQIPSTFANLKNMQRIWAADNEFTGKIPDFIGNWSNLVTLNLRGNSFEGPIPSTFANLTSLEDLRLTEISNMASSLDFIKDMKLLVNLILRNNNITGSIPLNIVEYQSLQHLDLSFNKLTGEIPASVFNSRSLTSLFLGNNSLSGGLPQRKIASLRDIDLSYNNLDGSFPSWIYKTDLQLNLVGNNYFKANDSQIGSLPPGLNCLQSNFPCNHGKGIYYNFGIKCGGNEVRASNGIVYESDNETLGPAMYHVVSTNRWAVSNVGVFLGRDSEFFREESAIFQTARLSASSLRYYGLGLENGKYNVSLQFLETAIESSASWRSLGRRVFNIYIQGILVLKDFDMRDENGAFSQHINLNFTARVTENYLEIHLFWAGKGTCCVPSQGTYGPSISAISATPDFIPTVSNIPPTDEKTKRNIPPTSEKKVGLKIGVGIGVGAVILFLALGAFYVIRRRNKYQATYKEELIGIDLIEFTFKYAQLKTATNNFDSVNKLGEGGFGAVYKGKLDDGRVVAIKQLSGTSRQGKSQFVAEIATISSVQHRSLVKLHGCCIEGDKRLLVYEYLENNSLDQALFGEKNLKLNWSTRFGICLGVARGLAYLHEESHVRIVHRDVKASNILLDSNLNPKISDFGLAKFYDEEKTHITTCVAGTFGYLAPEYAMSGHLTEKADVFAFGVVALEIVSGRPRSDLTLEEDKRYLLEWAWNLRDRKSEMDLLDPRLHEFDDEQVRRVISVALLCAQTSPLNRPSMSRVVAMLSGDAEVSSEISRPGYFVDWRFDDVTTQVTDDYCSSSATTTAYLDSSPTSSTLPMLLNITK